MSPRSFVAPFFISSLPERVTKKAADMLTLDNYDYTAVTRFNTTKVIRSSRGKAT